MLLLIISIGFFISNLSFATIEKKELCKLNGDLCQCCSDSNCYIVEDKTLCLQYKRWKRNSEDLIIPPYYYPNNQLYPYGISKPALPFYKLQTSTPTAESKKLEWDHCQFHEDCGEGNCCHVHFRFRSLPKWFCRPNRNEISELCHPLAKYRSLKDVPAWKNQQQR